MPSFARIGGKILRKTQTRDYPCECKRTYNGKLKSNPFQDAAPLDGGVTGTLHVAFIDPTSVPNLVGNPAAHELAMKIKSAVGQGACRILSSTELVARQCIHSNCEQRSLTMSIEVNQKVLV